METTEKIYRKTEHLGRIKKAKKDFEFHLNANNGEYVYQCTQPLFDKIGVAHVSLSNEFSTTIIKQVIEELDKMIAAEESELKQIIKDYIFE